MKNIHEILATMGIEVPAEKKADLDKELLANYRTLADYFLPLHLWIMNETQFATTSHYPAKK